MQKDLFLSDGHRTLKDNVFSLTGEQQHFLVRLLIGSKSEMGEEEKVLASDLLKQIFDKSPLEDKNISAYNAAFGAGEYFC